MVVRQGGVYWVSFDGVGSEPKGRRPAVVVQDDLYNLTSINTVVVAALTSNLRLGDAPGNVPLNKGEANLPRASVVNVTQLFTIDRRRLAENLGTLGEPRIREIRQGLAGLFGIETRPSG